MLSFQCKVNFPLLCGTFDITELAKWYLKKEVWKKGDLSFDYCDILRNNLTTDLSQRLQRVHNACVRFICNTRKYDHVSPSFEALGWLRLQKRRYIYSLVLLYNILNTPSPTYLSTRFHLLSSYNDLSTRSWNDPILLMPSHRTSQYSSSITATVSHSWNSLLSSLMNCQNISQFKTSLFRHVIINSPFL